MRGVLKKPKISLGGKPPWEEEGDDSFVVDVQNTDASDPEDVDDSRLSTPTERKEIYSKVQCLHRRTGEAFKLSYLNRKFSSEGVTVSQWCTTSNRTIGDYERLAKVFGLTLLELWSANDLTDLQIADVRKVVAKWE